MSKVKDIVSSPFVGVYKILRFPFITLNGLFGKKSTKPKKAVKPKSSSLNKKSTKSQTLLKNKALVIDINEVTEERNKSKMLYRYVAKDPDGKTIKGKFYAFSKVDVHSFLLSEGYEVYSIEADRFGALNAQVGGVKFKLKDIIFFLSQLSTYLRSGISLIDGMRLLSKQADSEAKKQVYQAVVYELIMGENFSVALEKQGNAFPKLLVNMVKTAELTGGLADVLDDMEDYYTTVNKTRKQMISAMTYPTIIMFLSLGILVFIMAYVIPQFVGIYDSASIDLPPITQVIIAISSFLQQNVFWLIGILIAFITAGTICYKKLRPFRVAVQWTLLKIPVVKNIILYNEVTMFTKTFASLLNHNVFIKDSMEILGNITTNELFKAVIANAMDNLQKGENISAAFKDNPLFPSIAYEMLLTGEKTGELGPMMDKVADYYQELHANLIQQMKSFIEPIMICTLAFVVGGVLLAIIIPMFNLYSELG